MAASGASPHPSRSDVIAALVAGCIEAIERGDADPVAKVCERDGDAVPKVRAQLKQLVDTGLLVGYEPMPERIGPYRLLQQLGRGGMGLVYLAEQDEPIQRRVALKLIKLGMDSREVVARFRQEQQALALMAHDGIAKVFDCGTTERGQPFFVMELVRGQPITRFCAEKRLDLAQRLRLVQQACAAVTHAHHKGVVHRDLTPNNILVQDDGAGPQVKVIDFGLAKAMGTRLVEQTLHTEFGRVLGTPEYMAPEQAAPGSEDVDTRVDVYSLGVILYELLTGTLPFASDDLRKDGVSSIQRVLREVEPPRPSTRVSTLGKESELVAASQRTTTVQLRRVLRNDLDWVVLKAMEKDRNRRYDSPAALASDLQRFLDHEPVLAGPPSAAYRLRKLARKYRLQLSVAAAVLVGSVAFGAVAWVQKGRADHAAQNERIAREDANRQQKLAEDAAARSAELAAQRQQALQRFDQLAAVPRAEQVVEATRSLWPPWPARIPALESWLHDACDPLLARREELRASVAALRAAPSEVGDSTDADVRAFLATTLDDLLRRLDAMETGERASVELRLAFARQLAAMGPQHPRARVTWADARAALAKADGVVASERYRGVALPLADADVVGLVPIGMNPATKLWEFYDLRSAWDGKNDVATVPIPEHRADGTIPVGEATGIVFVLLPGGAATLGAQAEDPAAPNHDPAAFPFEGLHRVELAPFLLARHEVTQAQWRRLVAEVTRLAEPSFYKAGQRFRGALFDGTHPVETVLKETARRLLMAYGMDLPTEAQWEYGCRAGTQTPWSVAREQLVAHANLADQSAKAPNNSWALEEWNDGYPVHAPVGRFAANAFGLHDMHGNVMELCRDAYGKYGTERAGDGWRPGDANGDRVARGGGFNSLASIARSAGRSTGKGSASEPGIGCRAMRPLAR